MGRNLPVMADQLNLALLVLRLVFGLFLAYHGYNKFFGGGRLPGTARWFGSIGFKAPKFQALLAASTEVGAGVLLALGLLTPLASAAVIGVMVVAIVSSHWKVGFFIFKEGGGWEYCASIAFAAFAIGTIGAGEWSVDEALDIHYSGWNGALVAGIVGVLGGLAQLAAFYRPKRSS
jgi:putative oxidoreductase